MLKENLKIKNLEIELTSRLKIFSLIVYYPLINIPFIIRLAILGFSFKRLVE